MRSTNLGGSTHVAAGAGIEGEARRPMKRDPRGWEEHLAGAAKDPEKLHAALRELDLEVADDEERLAKLKDSRWYRFAVQMDQTVFRKEWCRGLYGEPGRLQRTFLPTTARTWWRIRAKSSLLSHYGALSTRARLPQLLWTYDNTHHYAVDKPRLLVLEKGGAKIEGFEKYRSVSGRKVKELTTFFVPIDRRDRPDGFDPDVMRGKCASDWQIPGLSARYDEASSIFFVENIRRNDLPSGAAYLMVADQIRSACGDAKSLKAIELVNVLERNTREAFTSALRQVSASGEERWIPDAKLRERPDFLATTLGRMVARAVKELGLEIDRVEPRLEETRCLYIRVHVRLPQEGAR
jgi:hypothetical protein